MTAVDTVRQKQETLHFEILTDIGQTAEGSSRQRDKEPRDGNVWRTVRLWKTVEFYCGHSDTEPTDGTL